jgi:hypothetical protein
VPHQVGWDSAGLDLTISCPHAGSNGHRTRDMRRDAERANKVIAFVLTVIMAIPLTAIGIVWAHLARMLERAADAP